MGASSISLLLLEYVTGSSCTLRDGVGVFYPSCGCYFSFHCWNFSAVILNITSNLLGWSIKLFSTVVFNFTFIAAVSCCVACTTASSGVNVGFLMHLLLN